MKQKLLYSALLFSVLFLNFSHAQQTYVPDNFFEQFLIDQGYDTVLDNYVLTANIETIASLDVNDINITDLTGLADFAALTTLDVSSTLIVNLNVSSNTALTYLDASDTAITSLDLSNNVVLESVYLDNSDITSLDVSNNIVLDDLYLTNAPISSIDVSSNTTLTALGVSGTQITSIDVTNNVALTFLTVFNTEVNTLDLTANTALTTFKSLSTPLLNCISVADETAANAGTGLYSFWEKDDACTYSEVCNLTYVPDDAFEQYFIDLGYDSGELDDFVPTANIINITSIDISGSSVVDLTGIEDIIGLTSLDISFSTVSDLDVSTLVSLTELVISYTSIDSLDLSDNTTLTILDASNTPELECIQVADEDAANAGTGIYADWIKDADCAYSEDCEAYLSNPDYIFSDVFVGPNPVKNELIIRLNNDTVLNAVSVYDVSGKLILKSTNSTISTSHIASGMYMVQIATDKGSFTRRLVKN
ncbi:T9SS type A sorting domain-containing protein [Winogradskyella vidalii]|uniref:T9SS type A sorting domain-containing protein n=1 Tax=Winogradskyella vidalii TaxID=2615024 RepID=UPI0015C95606|nr:T9SS type A sorting domain-containing protein [Winogradskyella vidalii]